VDGKSLDILREKKVCSILPSWDQFQVGPQPSNTEDCEASNQAGHNNIKNHVHDEVPSFLINR
jgi:hypothetical protein